MFKIIMHGLLARKFRLFATALAVTLGVAFMAGTLVLTDTFGQTFNDLSAGVYKGTDAVVRATATFNGPQFTGAQRPFVDASLVSALGRVPGVAAAEGSAFGYTRLIGKDGKALGNPANGAPTLGGNWNQVAALNPWHLLAGQAPQGPGQVVIDKKSATDGHLRVGDFTTVLVLGPPQRVQVVGIIGFGAADSPAGASVVLFTTPVAQKLVAAPGKYTSIFFVAKPGFSQQQLVSNLRQALPHGLEAITGAAMIKETQDQFAKVLSFFNTFLLIFAIIALLVGAFMIFNTFSITVAQRTRENGLMRALGASKRQVLGSVLLEAVVVGVIASVIGLAAGVAVAIGLKAMLNALGAASLPTSGIVFTARTALIAGLAGLAVTMVAAVSPARKAAKVPPVAAMQDVGAGSTGYGSKERVMVGSAILVLGVAALVTGLFTNVASRVLVVGAGALLVFFGVSVLGRTVSLPLSRTVGAPLPRLRGVTGKLARQNAMRNPKRTAASASALMIGVGLVGFITILAASSTASVNSAIDRGLAGDIVVDSGGGLMGGVDPGLAGQLGKLPQVQAATGVAIGIAKVNGKVEQVSAVDPGAAGKIFDVSPVRGSIADLGRDSIAVYSGVATADHLKLGSTVPVVFKDTGPQKLTVALIYGEATGAPAPRYFMGNQAFNANFPVRYDSRVFVKKASGVSTAAALAAVRAVAAKYSGTAVMDQAAFKADQAKPIQQMLSLVYALLALAILIALLGIGNTLALSIFERTRELGVMRAVGMTRHQLRAMIRWESVIIALQGTVLGLLIGVFFGWVLVLAMRSQGITEFSVPVLSLVIVVVLAALAGAAAAIWPSRRAAKLNILRAIVTE
ncbi:MAG TPA: FtsX-like permease family protein [Streptosporangiaceae bacterium]|nr:FtsX-like permease family protein [Streptosporangiaceae bacterium]